MASAFLTRTRTIAIRTLQVTGLLLLLAVVALSVAVSVAVSQLPSFPELARRDNLGQMIRVRALDGSIIHTQGPVFGEWVAYDRIPQVMKNAIVAIEDRRFNSHWGVDPVGIARSVNVRLRTGSWSQGGSTITQQLARNIFLNNSRSFGRKMREAVLAMALEWRFSKEQILELYLNRVYFGGGAYGIDAASRRFFGHPATSLSLREAAIIAGLVKAPSNYSPTADFDAAKGRAGVVLDAMVEQEMITPMEARAADVQGATLAEPPELRPSTRYFTDWVVPQLDTLLDQQVSEPIDVWTTLDTNLQNQADHAIAAHVPPGGQGALLSLDRDGAIRAMVGGLDYQRSSYNRATQAKRQPGSSWKLFVYLAALEQGHRPDGPVDASAITVNGWTPRGSGSGPTPMKRAFALSINSVAVRLAEEAGIGTVANMARRFGITTPIARGPAMALGSSEVRVIDMARAYASIARGGVAVAPYGVRRVTTASGTVIYEHQDDASRQLVTPWIAAQMTDMMQAVVTSGTGRLANVGRPTAGKTGTTSSEKDGWFVGFSSGITTAVWYGRDDSKRIPGLAGGNRPAQAFHDYMAAAVSDRPVEPLQTVIAEPEWQANPDANVPGEDNLVDPEGPVPQEPGLPDDEPSAAPPPRTPREPRKPPPDEDRLDDNFIDRAINRRPAPRREPAPRDVEPEDARPEPEGVQ